MLELLVYWVLPFVLTLGAALIVNFAVQSVLHDTGTKRKEQEAAVNNNNRRENGNISSNMDTPSAASSSSDSTVEVTTTTHLERHYAHGFALEVGSCAIQGRRPYMEDRRTIIEDLRDMMASAGKEHNSPNGAGERCSFFAVFDGHGGQLASTFASGYLHKNLVKSAHFPHDPIRALEEACEITDRDFAEKYQSATSQDGTTACMVLIMGQRLYVANVGDSRAVLCRKGKAVALSDDHKPDKPSEKKRIEDSGGVVKKGSFFNIPMGPFRVYQGDGMRGGLAVSRALGDTFYKDPKRPAMEWLVSAIPEIKEESLQPGADEFFIVASDGFWDVFSNENAVLLTRELLQKKELSLADVAQTLTAKAFSRESLDNITVVIVRFISDGTMETSNDGADRANEEETDEMTVLLDEGGVVPQEEDDEEGVALDVDNEVIIREVNPSEEPMADGS
jgi:protein phosphatase 1L